MHCWDYYESKTEVWVFGDVDGYNWAAANLAKANDLAINTHLDEIAPDSNSMRVVILPAERVIKQPARVKAIERLVYLYDEWKMELVLNGNASGYDLLARAFTTICCKAGDPSQHIEYDDRADSLLVPRSVSLNIRAPLHQWSRSGLREYADIVFERQKCFLPDDVEYILGQRQSYEEISPSTSDFIKFTTHNQ